MTEVEARGKALDVKDRVIDVQSAQIDSSDSGKGRLKAALIGASIGLPAGAVITLTILLLVVN